MNRIKRYLPQLVLVVSCFLLFALNKSWFLTYVVDPIARIVWWVFRFFQIFDQEHVWNILILCVLITALWMVSNRQDSGFRSAYQKRDPVLDRVAFWKHFFRSAVKDEEKRIFLETHLNDLNEDIQQLTRAEDKKEIVLPPVTKYYKWNLIEEAVSLLDKIRLKKEKRALNAWEQFIHKVLCSMESRLEIHNEQFTDDQQHRRSGIRKKPADYRCG